MKDHFNGPFGIVLELRASLERYLTGTFGLGYPLSPIPSYPSNQLDGSYLDSTKQPG